VFSLKVHAQGDGINGAVHTQLFPSTITIDGCASEAITITNNGFTPDITYQGSARGWETYNIPDFTISSPYCPFHKYEITRETDRLHGSYSYYIDQYNEYEDGCDETMDFSTTGGRNGVNYRGCSKRSLVHRECLKWNDPRIPGFNW
jgi:hypothetical protein